MKVKNRIVIFFLIIMLLITSFSGCNAASKYKKYSFAFLGTFDTLVQVVGYTQNQRTFNKYASHSKTRFEELNELFDIYNLYDDVNNIKTINDNAGIKPVVVSREIIELIELSMTYNKQVSDRVNIAMGSVLRIWHDYREAGVALPSVAELNNSNKICDIDDVIIDKQNSTVFLANEGMILDMGSVAKGYATQIVADELKELGFESFLISSGGNVISVGTPLDGERDFWGIGIQNPFYFSDMENEQQEIDIAFVRDVSIVSSGNYQRYYYVDGARYHHLIDPDTLMPANYYSAISIVTEDSLLADFLSTAVYLLPYEESRALVESLESVEAYWIFEDGRVEATDNMIAMLKQMGGATSGKGE